ncbi:hypothetical protein GCM10025857_31760 [Alicyclobacillus contaminans]|uniref:hypothetical protein n=1 Tax=Alicyclobacillus contaminans TaxID=392016 RepID=UPI00042328D9|nr:hypothetical protein [Alicyclobacillus contaminans]GMA51819.1 hypothetical protein GCM10025857_31760 [Alicyclobacillus contaminans]
MTMDNSVCDDVSKADTYINDIAPIQSRALQGDSIEHRYFLNVRTDIDENGEPVIIAPAKTHYVRSYAQRDAYKENIERQQRRAESGEFSFHSIQAIREMSMIEDKHCGYLLGLTAYLGYDDIIHNTDRNRTPMSKSDVMSTLGISERTYQEFMTTMRRHGIIKDVVVDGIKTYKINRKYVFRGQSYKGLRKIKSFHEQVREMYSANNAKDLGFVYKLLPYVHWSTNYLSHNPDETDPDNVSTMSRKDLAEITKLDEKTLTSKMRRMRIANNPVFACVRVGDEMEYMLNPEIFYRRDGKPDDTIIVTFANMVRRSKERSENRKKRKH